MPKPNRSTVAALVASLSLLGLAACNDDDDGYSGSITDSQILGVLVTANDGEVQYSQFGVDGATDLEVKAFAAKMIVEHTAAREHVKALSSEANLPTADSDLSLRLKNDEAAEENRLQNEASRGSDFDLMFMCAQIRLHSNVLETIDDTLAPAADDARVRDEVTGMRPHVSDHLEEAKSLTQKVSGTQDDVETICQDRGGV